MKIIKVLPFLFLFFFLIIALTLFGIPKVILPVPTSYTRCLWVTTDWSLVGLEHSPQICDYQLDSLSISKNKFQKCRELGGDVFSPDKAFEGEEICRLSFFDPSFEFPLSFEECSKKYGDSPTLGIKNCVVRVGQDLVHNNNFAQAELVKKFVAQCRELKLQGLVRKQVDQKNCDLRYIEPTPNNWIEHQLQDFCFSLPEDFQETLKTDNSLAYQNPTAFVRIEKIESTSGQYLTKAQQELNVPSGFHPMKVMTLYNEVSEIGGMAPDTKENQQNVYRYETRAVVNSSSKKEVFTIVVRQKEIQSSTTSYQYTGADTFPYRVFNSFNSCE